MSHLVWCFGVIGSAGNYVRLRDFAVPTLHLGSNQSKPLSARWIALSLFPRSNYEFPEISRPLQGLSANRIFQEDVSIPESKKWGKQFATRRYWLLFPATFLLRVKINVWEVGKVTCIKMSAATVSDHTQHLPRILCLHGDGTNARIFRAQCRGLRAQLRSEFRLVFAQAPFPSNAGSDVLSVYSQWGPFRRWLRWRPEHPPLSPLEIIHAIDDSLEDAMARDDAEGATGEWVALLGFSQGAKVSASLLYRQQIIGNATSGPQFRFAVLLAGRAPLIALDPGMKTSSVFPDASQIIDLPNPQREASYAQKPTLRIPTLHVHGLRDTGVDLHRNLSEDFCDPHSRWVIEWDGDHRVPLRANDVARVVSQIRQLATDTEVSLGTIE